MKKTVLAAVACVCALMGLGIDFPIGWFAKPELKTELMKTELYPGVTYFFTHFKDLTGDGPVRVHWLVLEWDKCGDRITLDFARNADRAKHLCKDFPPPWTPTDGWDKEWANDRRWS